MNTRTLLALACCAALTACEKDDDDEPSNTPPAPVMRTVVWEISDAEPFSFEANYNGYTIALTQVADDTSFTREVPVGATVGMTVYHQTGITARILSEGVVLDNCASVAAGVCTSSGTIQ